MGIEPTRPAWKAGILPLNYTRMGSDIPNVSLDIIPRTILPVNAFTEKNKEFSSARLLIPGAGGAEEGESDSQAAKSGAESSIKSWPKKSE